MGANLACWYDTITSARDVQNHETLANRQIWYETLLLAYKEPQLRLFLLLASAQERRRLVMVTSSREGTMMPLVIPLAMA